MKKLLHLLLLMALAVPLVTNAYNQQVQVGTGTSTSNEAPINLYYNYSYTQQIYTAEQINGDCSLSGEIESISFYYAGSTAKTHPITVFMKATDKESFTSNEDWEPVSESDIVFDGDWSVPSTPGWVTITFNKSFAYDGRSNLLIAIDKEYGDSYSNQPWRYTVVTNNQKIHYRNDSTNPDPYAPPTATGVNNYLPNILFNMTIAHPVPTALVVDENSAYTANISWTAPNTTNTVTGYAYEYTDGETIMTGTTTGTTAQLTGLTPVTDYLFQVKAVYADGESCWSEMIDFSTLEACPTPRELVANNITANSAEISWTGSGADSYTVFWGETDPQNLIEGSLLNIDFNNQVIPSTWTNDGSFPWTIVDGYIQSSNAGVGSSSSMISFTMTFISDMTIEFDAECRGEGTSTFYDHCDFYIDNERMLYHGGDVNGWNHYSFNVTAGQHTFTWSYTKDTSVNPSGDYFAVDNINISGLIPTPSSWIEYNFEDPTCIFEELTPATTYMVYVLSNCDGVGQSQPSNTLSFTTAVSCLMPENLAVTIDSETATATWEGTASTYNIDINGEVFNNVTSPYEFRVELSTTYEVMVQANCDDESSDWTDAFSFTTPPCFGGHTFEYTLNDSYGDGWTGNAILLRDACDVIETLTIANGYTNSGTLTLCDAGYYQLTWQVGSYTSETSFTLIVDGVALYTNQSGGNLTNGQVLYTIGTAPNMPAKPTDLSADHVDTHEVELSWTENGNASNWEICVNGDEDNPVAADRNPFTLTDLTSDIDYAVKVRSIDGDNVSCWSDEITFHTAEACAKPTNLTVDNIATESATLFWEGTSNSYMVQYRPWFPAGDDIITTATMTTYTVDLSQYEGTGAVAIRHYDVSDKFQLIVDDIVVTDAEGNVIYSQDFENCGGSMPSEFSNMDLDGDGFMWQIAAAPESRVNGSYGIVSESYNNNYGALFPDNWLILSGIEMGGTMTFQACGQDESYSDENFAIYVSTENSIIEQDGIVDNMIDLWELIPNTPYAWQVKGVCGEEESQFSPSFFKTLNDAMVFVSAGDWNDLANWEDANGNPAYELPTNDNNVRIEEDAIIPSGYVATANKTTLGDNGSITIEEGGQLKQNSASVKLTMLKTIAGYGAGNEEQKSGYYFISSPFTGRTLFQPSGSFSYVDGLLDGTYDLYAFDPAIPTEEWVNYEYNPDHFYFKANNDLAGLLYGEGFLYANEEETPLTFWGTAGKSFEYEETKDYVYDDASTVPFNGWRLAGNFFTCDCYISYIDEDGEPLEANFYMLNAEGDGYEQFSSSDPVPPLTGAFVNYSATGKIQYSTEPSDAKRTGILNMTLSQGRGKIDQARLRFGKGFNLDKVSFRANSSKVYIPQDGKDFSVAYTEENMGEMPVSFEAENNGTYTLSFNTDGVSFGYLHLIDNMTGNDVDLLANPSYSFDAKTTDYTSRFKLVFSANNANMGDDFAFVSDGDIILTGNGTLQMIDLLGHVIFSNEVNSAFRIPHSAFPSGVYVLRLINGNDIKTQKIVVK